jgi:hypothetical protein
MASPQPDSEKTAVIEHLFGKRWDAASRTLSNSVVTLEDVAEAIRDTGVRLSTRNPANFMKDVVRRRESYFRTLPSWVEAAGYGPVQRTGDSACFRFEPIETVRNMWVVLDASGMSNPHRIESVSMQIASRKLGREEETWVTQVLTRLRLVETHLALYSPLEVAEVDHLQISVKQRDSEIDALFLAQVGDPNESAQFEQFMVCCEVKGFNDDILKTQIVQQLKAVASNRKLIIDGLLPLAVKTIRAKERCLVHVVEFKRVAPCDVQSLQFETLEVATQQVYDIYPPVPGLTEKIANKKVKPKNG